MEDVSQARSLQGEAQGNPAMGAAFCLAIHHFAKKLPERLTREAVEETAIFNMDDGCVIGPPDEVFDALEEFLCGLREMNLMATVDEEMWTVKWIIDKKEKPDVTLFHTSWNGSPS